MGADGADIGVTREGLIDKTALRHHVNAVGQLHQLIQVFRQEQDGSPAIASPHDARPDFRNGGEVEAETGIGDDQQVDLAVQTACSLLLNLIEGRTLASHRVLVPTHLVVRDSTAPPARSSLP